MLVPALLGGLFVGVLSALPFVNVANCCCLWIFTGGLLAAYVLQQNEDRPIGAARGAVVGLLAGVTGAFVWLLVTVLLDPIIAPFQQQMLASMAPNASDLPPEMQSLFDSLAQPGSAPLRFAMGFIAQLFTGAVFSTIGGLVGSSIFVPVSAPHDPPPVESAP
jgi:hypothetical protein